MNMNKPNVQTILTSTKVKLTSSAQKCEDLWREKQYTLHQLRLINDELREPGHSHESYKELEKNLAVFEVQLEKIEGSLKKAQKKREWRRDTHRLIKELKELTTNEDRSTDNLLTRVIRSLMYEITLDERIKITTEWGYKNKKELRRENEEQRQKRNLEKKEKQKEKQNDKAIKKRDAIVEEYKEKFPEDAQLPTHEIMNKVLAIKEKEYFEKERKKRAEKKKRKAILQESSDLLRNATESKPTEESIQYYRKKWGISDASLEEKEEIN